MCVFSNILILTFPILKLKQIPRFEKISDGIAILKKRLTLFSKRFLNVFRVSHNVIEFTKVLISDPR